MTMVEYVDINGGGVGSSPTRGGKEESVNINVYGFFSRYGTMKKQSFINKKEDVILHGDCNSHEDSNRKQTGTALLFLFYFYCSRKLQVEIFLFPRVSF